MEKGIWIAWDEKLVACLWDCETGDGETSDEITDELLECVVRAPVENGEDVFEAQDGSVQLGLVLELPETVVVEERLFGHM